MYDTEHLTESTARHAELDARRCAVLSNSARKRILAALNEQQTLTFSELARLVSDGDDGDPTRASPGDEEHRTAVMLYHCDLPKLVEYGMVEWESESDRVMLTREGVNVAASLGL